MINPHQKTLLNPDLRTRLDPYVVAQHRASFELAEEGRRGALAPAIGNLAINAVCFPERVVHALEAQLQTGEDKSLAERLALVTRLNIERTYLASAELDARFSPAQELQELPAS